MSDEQPVGKAERQQALVERIIGGQQPSQPARAELERLLGPDELAKVDERLLAVITDEGEAAGEQAEPESFFDGARRHQAERNLRLRNALLGHPTPEATSTPPSSSSGFDGGARQTPKTEPSHDETLIGILRGGEADVGRNL